LRLSIDGTGNHRWHSGSERAARGAANPVVLAEFDACLSEVRELAATDPRGAARMLFDFAMAQPGYETHSLVETINKIGDRLVRLLALTPLPDVQSALLDGPVDASPGDTATDVARLLRAVLTRYVSGLDAGALDTEIVSLALAA
jgi:hypothetical protein